MSGNEAPSERQSSVTSLTDLASPTQPAQSTSSTTAAAASASMATATVTLTETETQEPPSEEILRLSLRPRQTVTWDEGTVNNEGLGRKSSKRCCIFHKQRPFGESSTDSSDDDYDSDDSGSSSSSGGNGPGHKKIGGGKKKKSGGGKKKGHRKIARPKSGSKKVPDYQRFHA